jgi:hypothetical protein
VITIYNPNSSAIKYRLQTVAGGRWYDHTVEANSSYFHYQPGAARFSIEFDGSFAVGYQRRHYTLSHNAVTWKANARDGRKYEFTRTGDNVDLIKASAATTLSHTQYGVVAITNGAAYDVPFQIQYTANGFWDDLKLRPGESRAYWIEEPAKFRVRFDDDPSSTNRQVTYALEHNMVHGRTPRYSDGRPYYFSPGAGRVAFMKGERPHVTAKPSLPGFNVSIIGRGGGSTADGRTFPDAVRASGTMTLEYTVDGSSSSRTVSWKAAREEDITSDVNALYRTQIWKFTSEQLPGSTATATIRGSASGASGTASVFYLPVRGKESVKFKFDVQFAGDHLTISLIRKAY